MASRVAFAIIRRMTRDEARTWIEKLIAYKGNCDCVWDQLSELTNITTDSPFGESFWRAINLLIEAVSALIGDESDTLDWYIWDNDAGAKGYEYSLPDKSMRSVKSTDDLLDVLGF